MITVWNTIILVFLTNHSDNLLHLKSLSLQSIQINPVITPDEFQEFLRKLPLTLEELFINFPCCFDGFAEMLTKFTSLQSLGIQDIGYLPVITDTTFEALRNLSITHLRLQLGNLLEVHPLAFSHFVNLKTLDMSNTLGLTIADLSPAWLGLQHTTIETLKLSFVLQNPLSTDLVTLNCTFFEYMYLPNLANLEMDSTKLNAITYNFEEFRGLDNLKTLNLSNNLVSIYELYYLFGDSLQYLKGLSELDVSNQFPITASKPGKVVDLHLALPSNLSKLNLSSIKPSADPISVYITMDNKANIEYFSFQNNQVKVLTGFDVWDPNPTVSFTADFSRNDMLSFADSFNYSIRTSRLRISSLVLHENLLGEELGANGDKIFKAFKDLKTLDLASNQIKSLPYSTFENQHELEFLDLSKNSLSQMNFKISQMTKIRTIDVSENLLSQFDKSFQDVVDLLKSRSPNFTVNMLGNPIQCSCENLQYLWWMYRKQSMFIRYKEYTCLHDNEQIKFINMRKLLDKLDYRCSLDLVVKVSAGILVSIILVVTISFFLYRHKWDVRFFCLKFITDRKAYQEFEESVIEYEYDAFVAYHKNDLAWVRNELYQNLDKMDGQGVTDDQPRFRLCIHDRDSIPGDAIEENILRAIESSRKTIVVLSRNFLQSVWCEFELQIARKECIEKGRNLIIAVMLEELPVDSKMSSSVRRLIRANTYIEWPQDLGARNRFWDKMRAALEI